MSIANYNAQKKAEKEAAAKLSAEGAEVKKDQENAPSHTQTEYAELSDWVSPNDVNYKELEEILDGEELSDYVGDRLPEEEVKRIETDYKLYLKNK